MTAEAARVCACCCTTRPAAEVYQRVPHSSEWFCTDTTGCRRRMASVGDPVAEFLTTSPPPAVPGARCAFCGTVDPPGGVYARGAAFMCLDRGACTERSVDFQFLTAHREDFPEVANTSITGMMHSAKGAGAQMPAARTELSHAEMANLAAQEALGRKRPEPDPLARLRD